MFGRHRVSQSAPQPALPVAAGAARDAAQKAVERALSDLDLALRSVGSVDSAVEKVEYVTFRLKNLNGLDPLVPETVDRLAAACTAARFAAEKAESIGEPGLSATAREAQVRIDQVENKLGMFAALIEKAKHPKHKYGGDYGPLEDTEYFGCSDGKHRGWTTELMEQPLAGFATDLRELLGDLHERLGKAEARVETYRRGLDAAAQALSADASLEPQARAAALVQQVDELGHQATRVGDQTARASYRGAFRTTFDRDSFEKGLSESLGWVRGTERLVKEARSETKRLDGSRFEEPLAALGGALSRTEAALDKVEKEIAYPDKLPTELFREKSPDHPAKAIRALRERIGFEAGEGTELHNRRGVPPAEVFQNIFGPLEEAVEAFGQVIGNSPEVAGSAKSSAEDFVQQLKEEEAQKLQSAQKEKEEAAKLRAELSQRDAEAAAAQRAQVFQQCSDFVIVYSGFEAEGSPAKLTEQLASSLEKLASMFEEDRDADAAAPTLSLSARTCLSAIPAGRLSERANGYLKRRNVPQGSPDYASTLANAARAEKSLASLQRVLGTEGTDSGKEAAKKLLGDAL